MHPAVGNIVPARGELLHEMREPDPAVLDRLARECVTLAKRVARRRKVQVEFRPSPRPPARALRGYKPSSTPLPGSWVSELGSLLPQKQKPHLHLPQRQCGQQPRGGLLPLSPFETARMTGLSTR